MKIEFKTIRFQNFLSSGNQWTEIQLNSALLTLIVGKNGAGKSTLLDALAFCLFKKPFRKLPLGLLVNTITRKNTLVEVEFAIGSDQYKIVRGLKPNKFEVYKNDTLVNQTNSDDYQSYLEEHILCVNHKAFVQVVVLGSASYVPFLELPMPQRREIIENLLDLELFSTMNVILKKRIQENDKLIVSLNNEMTIVQDRIDQQREYNEKRKIQVEEEVAELEKKLDDLRKQLKDKKSLLVNDMTEEIEELKKNVIYRSRSIAILEENLRSSNNALNKIQKEIDFYRNSCVCDTCGQDIDELFKQDILNDKEIEAQEIRGHIYDLKVDIEKENEIFREDNKNFENKTILKQLQDLLKVELRSLIEQGKETKERVDRLKAEIITPDNDALNGNLTRLDGIIGEYNKEMKSKEIMTILLKLLKDDGIKAKVIHQYIGMINKFINEYLEEMEFNCQFNLDENFNEVIKSRYRDEFVWNSFSEGEKMRIDLALLLTWRKVSSKRNSINTNILFFDEVLDSSLDSEGIDSYLEIIKRLTEGSNVFIISHNDKNIDRIDNNIKFVKRKGFSRIENTFDK
jgi:DNA repair exonuclease SbcCD ATPase subunit